MMEFSPNEAAYVFVIYCLWELTKVLLGSKLNNPCAKKEVIDHMRKSEETAEIAKENQKMILDLTKSVAYLRGTKHDSRDD
jgi:hypothetical protein